MAIGQAINDTLNLVKNTFTIISKNREILRPTYALLKIGIIQFILLFLAVLLAVIGGKAHIVQAILLFVLFILVGSFAMPFLSTYFRAAQVWIAYRTFCGEQATYYDGLARAKENKSDIFWLGLLDLLLTKLSRKLNRTGRRRRQGFLWIILNLALRALGTIVEEGWDLLGHFLLPASIIQEKTLRETLPEIKNLKNNVPAALAGVFGLDFAGDMIRGLISFFMLLIFVGGSIVVAILTKTVLPVLFGITIFIILQFLMNTFMEMVKTIYFTLMYVSITMPQLIREDMKDEVTSYLKHEELSEQETESLY